MPNLAFLSSPYEIAVVLIIGLLIFGRKLPSIARNMGSSINEFKAGLKEPASERPRQEIDSGPSSAEETGEKKDG